VFVTPYDSSTSIPAAQAKGSTHMQLAHHRRYIAGLIEDEDRVAVRAYNGRVHEDLRLRTELGPSPYEGDLNRAPVVMLLGALAYDEASGPDDHAFERDGWPLAGLHPEAPPGVRQRWHRRLAPLVDSFGAQHVANSVLALHVTPWACRRFNPQLRLPSRRRMLHLASDAVRRGALMMVLRGAELWTEHADIAALPPSRRIHARSWRASHVHPDNVGDEGWGAVCRRVHAHVWDVHRS
jgi:hypothetical protein